MKLLQFFLATLTFLSVQVFANTPVEIATQKNEEIISLLKQNKNIYITNKDLFYSDLENALESVVDSEGIAKSVMTVKYSSRASNEQIARFVETFKKSLFQFYSDALLGYDNQILHTIGSNVISNGNEQVNMELNSNGAIYPFSYTFTQVNGVWKIRNVIINGINIGKLFRDQFQDQMNRHKSVEKVINNWGNVIANTKGQ